MGLGRNGGKSTTSLPMPNGSNALLTSEHEMALIASRAELITRYGVNLDSGLGGHDA